MWPAEPPIYRGLRYSARAPLAGRHFGLRARSVREILERVGSAKMWPFSSCVLVLQHCFSFTSFLFTNDPDRGSGMSDLYADSGLPHNTRTEKERHRHPVLLTPLMRLKQGRNAVYYISADPKCMPPTDP